MGDRNITQIPIPGNSGQTPTGAMQFQDDWPGLFIRGDDAIVLLAAIEQIKQRLSHHPDAVVASAVIHLSRYAEIISRDVVVRKAQ